VAIYEVRPESINQLHIEAVQVTRTLPVRVSHLLSVKGITCIALYDVIIFFLHLLQSLTINTDLEIQAAIRFLKAKNI